MLQRLVNQLVWLQSSDPQWSQACVDQKVVNISQPNPASRWKDTDAASEHSPKLQVPCIHFSPCKETFMYVDGLVDHIMLYGLEWIYLDSR
jgi:hypothetical protein